MKKPKSVVSPKRKTGSHYLKLSNDFIRDGQFSEGLDALRQATIAEPLKDTYAIRRVNTILAHGKSSDVELAMLDWANWPERLHLLKSVAGQAELILPTPEEAVTDSATLEHIEQLNLAGIEVIARSRALNSQEIKLLESCASPADKATVASIVELACAHYSEPNISIFFSFVNALRKSGLYSEAAAFMEKVPKSHSKSDKVIVLTALCQAECGEHAQAHKTLMDLKADAEIPANLLRPLAKVYRILKDSNRAELFDSLADRLSSGEPQ